MSGLKKNAEAMFGIQDFGRSSKSLLWIDLHAYLDSDGSGTSTTCTTDQASNFAATASLLADAGRQALITEIGGSSSDDCVKYLTQALAAINKASLQYLGIVGWAAGAFPTTYELSMVPANGKDPAITKVYVDAFQ
jgi:endoglucanase